EKAGVRADLSGRAKHLWSIAQKMRRKGVGFEEVYDVLAIRVIVDDVPSCYAALGVVHTLWPPIPGQFDDYIAVPKANMYQSLHTAVIGTGGQPVEIQVRTRDMHDLAEYGIAALDPRLASGDIVEIVTSKAARGPSRDWLGMVRTPGAREKIRAWFKRAQRDENITHGKELLDKELRRISQRELGDISDEDLRRVTETLNLHDVDTLF